MAREVADQSKRLAEQEARSARTMKIWLAVCLLFLVVAAGAAGWALHREEAALRAEQTAKEKEAVAEAQRKTALESRAKWFVEYAVHERDDEPVRSLLLALESHTAAEQLPITETTIRQVLGGIGGQPLIGHASAVNAVAFAPDGHTLASASWDSTIRLWELDLKRVWDSACKTLSRNLSYAEWLHYFGNEVPHKTCENRPLHPSFLDNADAIAAKGEIDMAVEAYEAILAVQRQPAFDPEARARRYAATTKRLTALSLASAGLVDDALAAYQEALSWDPELVLDVNAENDLCWSGSLWNRGADVMPHCEHALALAPGHPSFRDSRGVARANAGLRWRPRRLQRLCRLDRIGGRRQDPSPRAETPRLDRAIAARP